ncbi:tRNA pseudouridine synthase A 1 isoform X1 [Oryza brachyantha]|uniref:tRNA pseudouridine synthase A 1 isoform X1 n=1 Tax=Oryza brachyantha TaxID=4533 RepID=UPI0007763BD7|nr:tRNA pseudouridine synthase A 1 isoform X1 [Oryza brachyantha]XP_040379737.1 tRNA pseudouridine synthase A 1 isoform X1 [Oryza brachyantha]XP_040379738.1 tRNA pseudouridine synthase A 1 isoform X1 [Oryza brachyantha]XP_040379739.1 tRNA pseudouridine synthase A 1 isoform X1 [Oryza brachyantha]XP_040379740.1 tRNA pseudouridine synthase A 1 isoform X1 [Oryza brachyantha]XP_040379741.1 tRNA pseudouridine synthase A 1 isoform X1 [Oryza brachyantha]
MLLATVRFAPPPPRVATAAAAAAATGGNISLRDGAHCAVPPSEEDGVDMAWAETAEGAYKWRMVIAYDGTKFKGWQYQPSPPTIQCCIENALTCITKLDRKELCLIGSGRTDTGVHAWGQVAHFTTPFSYHCLDSIHSAINGLLPHEIRVREISAAKPEFHARTSTKSKIYHYKIYNGAVMDPFHNLYAYHSVYKLNSQAMREAAKHFVGIHDFTSFANAVHNDRVRSPIKKIMRFDVIEMGAILQLEVEGTGFLYRQVRNMVALLLQVGREALPPDIVPHIIAARDRRELAKVALSAPPHGLYLMAVNYDKEMLNPPEGAPPISFGRTHQISKCKLLFY